MTEVELEGCVYEPGITKDYVKPLDAGREAQNVFPQSLQKELIQQHPDLGLPPPQLREDKFLLF